MDTVRSEQRDIGIRELLEDLKDELKDREQKKDTKEKQKTWKYPFGWKSTMEKGNKTKDMVVVFYLNIKGEMEPPIILPLYSGNMVIVRNKTHEVDPRAFWTIRVGFKQYKVMLLKEIDRRPVSNLDYDEIKRRGDSTDSDEFLIKAALRAQTAYLPPGMNKWIIAIVAVIIIGLLAFFMFGK